MLRWASVSQARSRAATCGFVRQLIAVGEELQCTLGAQVLASNSRAGGALRRAPGRSCRAVQRHEHAALCIERLITPVKVPPQRHAQVAFQAAHASWDASSSRSRREAARPSARLPRGLHAKRLLKVNHSGAPRTLRPAWSAAAPLEISVGDHAAAAPRSTIACPALSGQWMLQRESERDAVGRCLGAVMTTRACALMNSAKACTSHVRNFATKVCVATGGRFCNARADDRPAH